MSTSDNKVALISAMRADTVVNSWVLHGRFADALELSIRGHNELCALSRLLISAHDINRDTNLNKPPVIADLLHIFDAVVCKLVCHGIKSMHILMLTDADEESRYGYGESSLDTADANFVEVGVEGL